MSMVSCMYRFRCHSGFCVCVCVEFCFVLFLIFGFGIFGSTMLFLATRGKSDFFFFLEKKSNLFLLLLFCFTDWQDLFLKCFV